MNTFHISPSNPLAHDVVDEIRTFSPDTLVAIRGETIYWDDEPEDVVYTVSEHPDPGGDTDYVWTYVRAGDWLAEYDAIQSGGEK
jgi:hypothetical protein